MRRRRPRDSRGREAAIRAGLASCLLVITFLPSSCASRSAIPPQGQAQTPPTPPDAVPARPGASATTPPPAAAVPDQPTPSPETRAGRPYRKILELKRSGATDQELLVRIRAENVNYQLTSSEILELRRAGVSQEVLEEMLRSGQR